ncbi:MAG: helix-turn-helix domain-containing protein [Vibrio sp.]
MLDHSLLDEIILDDFYTELRRIEGKSAAYYHWHQCLELLYVESGVGLVVVDNNHYTLKPGRLFIFPKGKLHKIQVENTEKNIYKRTVIHINDVVILPYLKLFNHLSEKFKLLSSSQKASIYTLDTQDQQYINLLLHYFTQKYSNNSQDYASIALLFLNIIDLIADDFTYQHHKISSISSKIMQYVEDNFKEKITLKDIAAHNNISEAYTSRIFKQETGGTLQEYIIVRRVKYACYLLTETDHSIAEIAVLSGFRYTTYFIKCFNKVIGSTPLIYRKKNIVSIS